MSICYACGHDRPDQSDKELFDAQMIEKLKDRVSELETQVLRLKVLVKELDFGIKESAEALLALIEEKPE